jgi:hypothetical protein
MYPAEKLSEHSFQQKEKGCIEEYCQLHRQYLQKEEISFSQIVKVIRLS